jgi:hypothetical protein
MNVMPRKGATMPKGRQKSPEVMRARRRAFTLKVEGKSWGEIVELLTLEGFTDSSGKPYAANNLKSEFSKVSRDPTRWAEIMGAETDPSQERDASRDEHGAQMTFLEEAPPAAETVRAPHDEPDVTAAPDERASHDERQELAACVDFPATREELAEFIRAIVREETKGKQTARAYANEDMPPEPETLRGMGRGRKESRDYHRLTTAIDKELFKLFSRECKQRKLSTGKLLDAILWNRYGKPKLSYMGDVEPADPEERDAS